MPAGIGYPTGQQSNMSFSAGYTPKPSQNTDPFAALGTPQAGMQVPFSDTMNFTTLGEWLNQFDKTNAYYWGLNPQTDMFTLHQQKFVEGPYAGRYMANPNTVENLLQGVITPEWAVEHFGAPQLNDLLQPHGTSIDALLNPQPTDPLAGLGLYDMLGLIPQTPTLADILGGFGLDQFLPPIQPAQQPGQSRNLLAELIGGF